MNWITYGLFITSLPELLEFLPAPAAKTAQDWITANVGSHTTLAFFIFGILLAAFLAWKRLDDERVHHIDAHTLAELTQLLAESDELFDRVRTVALEEYAAWEAAWTADFKTWHQHAYETIEKKLSKADAILFARLDASRPTLSYRHNYSDQHNRMKNALANYQSNLRAIIERHL